MAGYAVARLEEIEQLTDGREPWRPVRAHLGITAFGVNAWTGQQAGDRIINEHDEDEPGAHEELYLVLAGRASFELGGEKVDAPSGTFVFAQPGVKRTAFAQEPGTTIIAVGAPPGSASDTAGWELWAPLNPLYEAGRYSEVAERGRQLVSEHPNYSVLFYNLACSESQAGQVAAAVEHLGQSIELSEESRRFAAEDSDFDPIRADPGFKALISAANA
jgi:tetratricopeptide (TPR) repeat protein